MGVSEAMTWTIYTFGDGDLIVQLLQAVALLVNGGLGSLIKAAAMAGLIAVLGLGSIGAIDWSRIVGWFVGFVLVFVALVQLRTTVAVEDVVDVRIPAQVVGDVPLAFALPAAVASEVSYQLSNLATALQLNGEMGNGLQMLRPTADLQALLEVALAPGDLRANLINYLHVCVVPEGSGISPVLASRAADLASFIESNDVAIMMPVIRNGQESGAMSCMDMYHQILLPQFTIPPVISQITDDGLRETVQRLACRVTGGRQLVTGAATINPCADPPSPWDELTSALQAVRMDLATPQQAFWTVVIAKLWPEAELDLARERMDSAAATAIANDGLIKQLEIQAKTGQQIGKSGLLRQIRALADGFVYLGAPMLLALSVTPFVWKGLGLYLRLFVWLAFWGPLQVIANFVILGVSTSDLTSAGTAITMGNLQQLFTQVVQANAMGYETLIAVPGIALALAWGSVSAVGGLLSGTGAGVQRTGEDVRRRVESGEQVLASSMRAPLVEGDFLRRPPNIYDTPTSAFQKGWGSHAVTQGIAGSSITLPDGRQITTRNDGSARIVSPTQEVSITPEGNKTGWQLLDQAYTVSTPEGEKTLHKGQYVQWTGHGAIVNLPSETDPLTGQAVAARAAFAQDPKAPGGFGQLMTKTWEFARDGLTYRATQDAEGNVNYQYSGRTDFRYRDRDGVTTEATGDISGQFYLPKGAPLGEIQSQARVSAVTKDGKRVNVDGMVMFAHDATNPRDRMVFTPVAGDITNVIQSHQVDNIAVNGVRGVMKIETDQGPDGEQKRATVNFGNGLVGTVTIPSNLKPGENVFMTVQGMLKQVRVQGGGREGDLPVTMQVDTTATLTLPKDMPKNWKDDPAMLKEAIAEALSAAEYAPFHVSFPDPEDPTRTVKATVQAVFPFGTASGSMGMRIDGQSDISQESVPASSDPVAVLSSAESSTTHAVTLAAGRTNMPGTFEFRGETEINGGSLFGRHGVALYHTPDGRVIVLGEGQFTATRNSESGQWEIQSLKTYLGQDMVENNQLRVDGAVEEMRGVLFKVSGTRDPKTGKWIAKTAEIGVTPENLQKIMAAFKMGPVTPEVGGKLTIINDGQVTYEGPAMFRTQVNAMGQTFRDVPLSGQAKLQGVVSNNGAVVFQSGIVEATIDTNVSTAQMPENLRRFFKDNAKQDGKVAMTLSPDGQTLTVEGRAGDTHGIEQDARRIEQGTFERKQGVYHIDPQTIIQDAKDENQRPAWELLAVSGGQRDTRAMEQATKVAAYFEQQVSKSGTESGQATGKVKIDLRRLGTRLLRQFKKLNLAGFEIGGLFGSTETANFNLWVSAVRAIQDAAHQRAANASAKVPLAQSQRTYAKVFADTYTEALHALVQAFEQEVRGDDEDKHGFDAPIGKANNAAKEIMTGAGRAASTIGETVGKGVQAMINSGQPQKTDQANSNTPPPNRQDSTGQPTGKGPSATSPSPGVPPAREQTETAKEPNKPNGPPSAEVSPPGNVGGGAPSPQPATPQSTFQPQTGGSSSSLPGDGRSAQSILGAPDLPGTVKQLMDGKGAPGELALILLNEHYRLFREGKLSELGFGESVHAFFEGYYLKGNPNATEADRAQVRQAADDLFVYLKQKQSASPSSLSKANSGPSSSRTSPGAPPAGKEPLSSAPPNSPAKTALASGRPEREQAREQSDSSSPKRDSMAASPEPPVQVLDGRLKEQAEALEARKRSGELTEPEFRARLFDLIGRRPIVVEIAPGARYDFRNAQVAPDAQHPGAGQPPEKSGAQRTMSPEDRPVQSAAAPKLTTGSQILAAAEEQIQSFYKQKGVEELNSDLASWGSRSSNSDRAFRQLDLATGIQMLHGAGRITDQQHLYALYEVLTEGGKKLGVFEVNLTRYDFSDPLKIPPKPAGWDG